MRNAVARAAASCGNGTYQELVHFLLSAKHSLGDLIKADEINVEMNGDLYWSPVPFSPDVPSVRESLEAAVKSVREVTGYSQEAAEAAVKAELTSVRDVLLARAENEDDKKVVNAVKSYVDDAVKSYIDDLRIGNFAAKPDEGDLELFRNSNWFILPKEDAIYGVISSIV